MKKIILLGIGVLVCVGLVFQFGRTKTPVSVGSSDLSGKLIVFHAGSLSVPFKQIAEEFEKEHPAVEVRLEAAGSRRCARKISDLKRECDVMASADYTVIDTLLIPDEATWNIPFAANEMALVYHEGSRRSAELTVKNWVEILQDDRVMFGRSDPNADPCGYRAVLTLKLAALFYADESIAETLLQKDLRFIRPKETDLLALLEAGAIDYIFLYRSVAQQHGLPFLILPDEVNLKTMEYAPVYQQAQVQISGKKPGEFVTKTGAPMVYGLTIPTRAPHPDVALAFVDFVLSSTRGMAVMEACGQPSVVPSPSKTFASVPSQLKGYVTSE